MTRLSGAWSRLAALRSDSAMRRTLGYYLLFICLGLGTGVTGPTLPALADQTHTALGQMGLLFLTASAGYTIGTIVGGRVFDRVRGHPFLGVAQLASAGLVALVPSLPWFWLLLVVMAGKGMADGFINTGANTLLVWTHRDRVGPYMNALHFFFGVGAFLSPFLVAQVAVVAGGYRIAYWVLGAIAALVGLRILTMSGSPRPEQHPAEGHDNAADARVNYRVAATAALFLFFYVGAEIAFGGWIYTYAVTLGLASVAGAAYLTSGFWLAFTIGRLISIPMASRFVPKRIVVTATGTCLLILIGVIVLSHSSNVLWFVTLALGFCMAPIWPTGFTFAGQALRLTARASGIILLGDSLGGMVLPWLAGQVIGVAGPRAMVYLVFVSLLCSLLMFGVLLRGRLSRRIETG